MANLDLKNVSMVQGLETILQKVELTISEGRILGVLSLNPVELDHLGKIVAGLVKPTMGEITFGNQIVDTIHYRNGFPPELVGYFWGTDTLFPRMTAYDNLMLGQPSMAASQGILFRDQIAPSIKEAREYFNFQLSMETPPYRLNSREKLLLMWMKVAVQKGHLAIIGDMTVDLELEDYEKVKVLLRKKVKEGTGILICPGNPAQAIDLCDDVAVLRNGELVFSGPVDSISIEELFNYQNNSTFQVRQSIENKFHQCRAGRLPVKEVMERALKQLTNFCGINCSFALIKQNGETLIHLSKKAQGNPDLLEEVKLLSELPGMNDKIIKLAQKDFRLLPIVHSQGLKAWIGIGIEKSLNKKILVKLLRELSGTIEYLYTLETQEAAHLEQERTALRLSREMDIARNLQTAILPKSLEISGYQVAAIMETATEVGGDLYDIHVTELGNFISVGDVTGHGLPAGITALIALAAFHGTVESYRIRGERPPLDIVYESVNRALCTLNRNRIGSDKFLTQNYFLEQDGRFLASGTHEPAMIYRSSTGTVQTLHELTNRTGFLGISEYIKADTSLWEFVLDSEDMLLLYTDGLLEAKNAHDDQYGLERLEARMMEWGKLHPEKFLENLMKDLRNYAQDGDIKKHAGHFADDVTLLVLKRV